MLQVFNKNGTSAYGPVQTSTLWSGFNGNWTGHNDGDGIVLYDENADRWIISQFAIKCGTYPNYTQYELVAVSTTGDPTGSYYRYAFAFDYMPDYPKFGIWHDGYYMGINRFNTNTSGTPFKGAGACVMDRTKMLAGDPTASMIYFKTELIGGSGSAAGSSCNSMLPSDCDGTFALAGTSNYFTYIASDQLRVWALHTDWTTPANSTFTYVTTLLVNTFTGLPNATVPQLGTTYVLDGLGDRLMFRNQYRNFGTYEAFVTCHSVSVNGTAGIRWYEYRKNGSVISLYQQSTYAPNDGLWRWMGSIAMNASGDIGLAYSVSSSTINPSIYFTGRKSADPINQMTIPEGIIQTGSVSMTGSYSRWGDYTAMNVDPVDNRSFWTTQEYVGSYGGTWPWATKIASFQIPHSPVIAAFPASAINTTTATLSGTINPVGLASTYHFEWGTSTGYGNSSTSLSAGSGSSNVSVNEGITGLIAGTTCHFRLVGTNSEGTTTGDDFSFIAGSPALSTAAITSVTTNTAVGGGTITSDGGFSVSARGVCWSTVVNPTISDPHTSDGIGTGTFNSTLTGLSSGTTYHVRAYATNSAGTTYGADLLFTTTCAPYNPPFTQSFPGVVTLPNCWSMVDYVGNGQVWKFGTITGFGSFNPVLSANYAYLSSYAYGAGFSQNADLITPTLDFSMYSSVYLNFKHYFLFYPPSTATVSYSINNGSTWTQIQQWTSSTSNPTTFNQVIAAVGGQSQVKFKWTYTGTYCYYWAIDDITVSVKGLWIGGAPGTPTSWHTAANWDGGVPTASTNVYIPARASLPVVNATGAACNNLVIGDGATLTVNPTFKLTVNGNTTIY